MFLQGNSYSLPIQITDSNGKVITNSDIIDASFTIGRITKDYKNDGSGEVKFDYTTGNFIVPLTQEETFDLSKGLVPWQARFLFANGVVDGTEPKYESVIGSINTTIFNTEV